MKRVLGMGLLVLSLQGLCAEPVDASALQGTVLEVHDVASYSYVLLKTSTGNTWAAVERSPLKVGARITVHNPMVMHQFESPGMHKTFDTLVLGSLKEPSSQSMSPHGKPMTPDTSAAPVKVAKAVGPNAYTVAEVVNRATELAGKPVVVRAQVTKFNAGIMDRNWMHLRDGSGDSDHHTDDLLATGKAEVQVGNVVVLRGVVRVDQDFGAGYAYKVLISDVVLQP